MVAKIFCLLALTVFAVLPARADWKITKRASHLGKDVAVRRLEIDLEESETSENARLELAIFDPKKATLRVLDQPAEPRVSLAEMMQQQRALAGVNGGYFDPEYKAVGLLVSRGAIVQPLQKAKLLSGVLSAANGRFLIQRAAKFSAKQKPGEARQCGPFLIEDGKAISGLNETRFARRTFVATLAPDRAAIGDCSSVTLAQLAALLTLPELKIQRALNLDGGSSSGFWFDGKEGVFSIGEQKQVPIFWRLCRSSARVFCAQMSAEETTAARVIRVIAKDKKLPPEQLSPETKFEDLMMDSLDALNMIFALEEEFDISVPNADAVKMRSVGDAIAGVDELLAKKAAEPSAT